MAKVITSIVGSTLETDLELCKASAKRTIDFQKLATKRASPDIFLVALTSVCLSLAAWKLKAIGGILDLILLLDRFSKVVVDISISGIDLLSRSNIKLTLKRTASRFLTACFW